MLGTLVTDWLGAERERRESDPGNLEELLCVSVKHLDPSHTPGLPGVYTSTALWSWDSYYSVHGIIKTFSWFNIIFFYIFISKIDLSFLDINKRNRFSMKSHFIKRKEIFSFIHLCFVCWNDIAFPLWNSIAVKQICSVQIDAIWEFQI